MGKMKKKVNLGVFGVSPYDSNVVPQSCLDPYITSPKTPFDLIGFDCVGIAKIHSPSSKVT
jgi:hypothetical protein